MLMGAVARAPTLRPPCGCVAQFHGGWPLVTWLWKVTQVTSSQSGAWPEAQVVAIRVPARQLVREVHRVTHPLCLHHVNQRHRGHISAPIVSRFTLCPRMTLDVSHTEVPCKTGGQGAAPFSFTCRWACPFLVTLISVP